LTTAESYCLHVSRKGSEGKPPTRGVGPVFLNTETGDLARLFHGYNFISSFLITYLLYWPILMDMSMRTSEMGARPGNKTLNVCVCPRWIGPLACSCPRRLPPFASSISYLFPLHKGIFGQPKQVGTTFVSLFLLYPWGLFPNWGLVLD